MTTAAFVGDIFLYRGGTGSPSSPVTFTKVCQVFGMSGLGQTNALVDATTFCSAGSREYIGGLADGAEMTVECNYERDAAVLFTMITDVTNKAVRQFQVHDESGSPHKVFSFAATCLGWTMNPSVDDRNTITFTLKISGAITIS